MVKNKSFLILLTSLLSLGGLLFGANNEKGNTVSSAETTFVKLDKIEWNNQDYSYSIKKTWVEDINDDFVPLSGYCILVLYKSNISKNTYVDTSLLEMSVAGCNVNDHVLINGTKAEDVEDVKIYCFPEYGLFIYVPAKSIELNETYTFPTINILEGMTVDGTGYTEATRFEYRGIIGNQGKWEINPEPVEDRLVSYHKIEWNNIDYSDDGGKTPWVEKRDPSRSPSEGYCILIGFKEEGHDFGEPIFNATYFHGRGLLGLGYNIDTKIKVNGVGLIDVEDSMCYMYPQYGLFIYIPDESITFTKENYSVKLEFTSGAKISNFVFELVSFEYTSDIGVIGGWEVAKDPSELNKFPYTGIAGEWNNVTADATHTQTILSFGTFGTDYLKNDKIGNSTNLVTKNSSCGNKITINGVSLKEHPDALVTYAHGNCYVYIYLSKGSLVPSNGYKIVTLHIEEGTVFWDTVLPDTYLYLYNGRWVETKPEAPADEEYANALSIHDVFNVNEATVNEENPRLEGSSISSLDTFGLFIDFKLMSEQSGFTLYALGTNERNGLRLVVKGNTVSLFDATSGNTSLGSATYETFEIDEWFSLFIYTRIKNEALSIFVALDDITYIHADNVVLGNEENIGSNFNIYSDGGIASFKKATLKADNKKPVLTYSGKEVYGVSEGSSIIDFSIKCSAYDLVDGDVTSLITISWPEGSITNEKINKGDWEVKIVAVDKSNNTASKIVRVIATNKLEVTVTFDGKNPVIYKIGDAIACVPDPVKESEGIINYEFVGWYYQDKLWDFENDYITCDMNLESRFVESVTQYRVFFQVEGLPGMSSYDLYFSYGARVNMSMFEKDGYSLTAYVEDVEVTSIVVTQNMSVKLVYKNLNPVVEKGCKGEITSTATILSLLSGVAIVLLVLSKKKGEKDYE